jgi:hypothetical protein
MRPLSLTASAGEYTQASSKRGFIVIQQMIAQLLNFVSHFSKNVN